MIFKKIEALTKKKTKKNTLPNHIAKRTLKAWRPRRSPFSKNFSMQNTRLNPTRPFNLFFFFRRHVLGPESDHSMKKKMKNI
jgi:hypothetical protein